MDQKLVKMHIIAINGTKISAWFFIVILKVFGVLSDAYVMILMFQHLKNLLFQIMYDM